MSRSTIVSCRVGIFSTFSRSSPYQSYLHCYPFVLSLLSLYLCCSPCLRLDIRFVITADPKPETSMIILISRYEDPPSLLPASLLRLSMLTSLLLRKPWPPPPIQPIDLYAAVIHRFFPYLIRSVPYVIVIL